MSAPTLVCPFLIHNKVADAFAVIERVESPSGDCGRVLEMALHLTDFNHALSYVEEGFLWLNPEDIEALRQGGSIVLWGAVFTLSEDVIPGTVRLKGNHLYPYLNSTLEAAHVCGQPNCPQCVGSNKPIALERAAELLSKELGEIGCIGYLHKAGEMFGLAVTGKAPLRANAIVPSSYAGYPVLPWPGSPGYLTYETPQKDRHSSNTIPEEYA